MTAPAFVLRPVEPAAVSDEDMVGINAVINRVRTEQAPDQPPVPVEVTREQVMRAAGRVVVACTGDGAIVGVLRTDGTAAPGRAAPAVDVFVLPEYRNAGLDRLLLSAAAAPANSLDRGSPTA